MSREQSEITQARYCQ